MIEPLYDKLGVPPDELLTKLDASLRTALEFCNNELNLPRDQVISNGFSFCIKMMAQRLLESGADPGEVMNGVSQGLGGVASLLCKPESVEHTLHKVMELAVAVAEVEIEAIASISRPSH